MKYKRLLVFIIYFYLITGCDSSSVSSPTRIFQTKTETVNEIIQNHIEITPSPEPKITPGLELAIEKLVIDTMAQSSLIGITLGIRYDDQITYITGYGYADKENQITAGGDTVYMLGSVSKQFTAAGIMHLFEQGVLGLDDPISQYLTDIPQTWKNVTIRQLLTHTGGIPNYSPDSIGFDLSQYYTPEELMVKFTRLNMVDYEPGTRWEYSNRGYFLLGMIIKQITGIDYGDYLVSNILVPLGLEHTRPCIDVTEGLAQGYRIKAWGSEPEIAAVVNPSFAYGAGDLCSTAKDLLEWQAALATGRVVSQESYQMMITPTELPDGIQTGYGFGLEISKINDSIVISHAGGIPTGFITLLSYYPGEGYGIVLLTNTMTVAYNPLTSLETKITEEILGIP